MLVLSRKKNESIVINDDITIVVVEIRGDKVRLGVEAPKEVPVHRREVFDAIRRNEASAEGKTHDTEPRDAAKTDPCQDGRRTIGRRGFAFFDGFLAAILLAPVCLPH